MIRPLPVALAALLLLVLPFSAPAAAPAAAPAPYPAPADPGGEPAPGTNVPAIWLTGTSGRDGAAWQFEPAAAAQGLTVDGGEMLLTCPPAGPPCTAILTGPCRVAWWYGRVIERYDCLLIDGSPAVPGHWLGFPLL